MHQSTQFQHLLYSLIIKNSDVGWRIDIGELKKIENPETDLCKYVQLIFDKVAEVG